MDKQMIEEMAFSLMLAKDECDKIERCEDCKYNDINDVEICQRMLSAAYLVKKGYRRIPKNAVVIDKDENPCLSCPVPEDIQRDVDCSTICGSVRLGIDWQNQCKVLVKENKQLTKELEQLRKEFTETEK
jgi:hypothetical protein